MKVSCKTVACSEQNVVHVTDVDLYCGVCGQLMSEVDDE